MKKIALLLIVALCSVATSFAQPKGNHANSEKMFNARVQMFSKQLNLTPEQTVKFIPVYKNYLAKVKAVKRPDHKPTVENVDQAANFCKSEINYKRGILNVQEGMINDLKTVLNPTQLVQFMKVEGRMQAKIQGAKKRGEGKGKAPRAPRAAQPAPTK